MAGNDLLTINMITREAVRLWKNSNAFIQEIEHQYDDRYAQTGAKIGESLRIRLPNDYTVRNGPALQPQDTQEVYTTLVMATQRGVDVQFNSVDRLLKLDDYSKRILAPMINNLAGNVAVTVMTGAETGICNFAANFDSAGNVIAPAPETWLRAGALLSQNSAPTAKRKLILDPITEARTVASLAGLFNPSSTISNQFDTGKMRNALGFDWYMDQTVLAHTTGAWGSTPPTVNGALQTGTTLVVNALAAPLNAGDIVTIDGVYMVNRITKQVVSQLRQFVLTAAAPAGTTQLSIYPAIVPYVPGTVPPQPVQYQTVDNSPANGANINPVTLSGALYKKNIAFIPDAVTIATGDLELPRNVQEAARANFDGVSMRMITDYIIGTDQFPTRLDVLFGFLWVRPEWAVVIADGA